MMKKLLSLLISSASAEVIGGADTVTEVVVQAPMSLMTKGLIVTAAGLAGVFLVLCLFYLTIKLMQKFAK